MHMPEYHRVPAEHKGLSSHGTGGEQGGTSSVESNLAKPINVIYTGLSDPQVPPWRIYPTDSCTCAR